MKILIACEESQRVCCAFRAKGHEAYSCDVVDCSGGHPEWHIKQDVIPLINGNCEFKTCDGTKHDIKGQWDMIIAHPPCTYLTNAATRAFSLKATPAEKVVKRWDNRAKIVEYEDGTVDIVHPQSIRFVSGKFKEYNFDERGGKNNAQIQKTCK